MATTLPTQDNSTDLDDLNDADQAVRNSKDDAITTRQFEELVETTYRMDPYYGKQCRLALFLCGRLGMRRSELGHLSESWIDWDRSVITIPGHDPCHKGKDGGICGTCSGYVDQMAGVQSDNAYADAHDQLGVKDEYEPGGGEAKRAVVDAAELRESYWQPKSDAAVREVPFGAITRAEMITERFFERFDEWPLSVTAVNRRVDRVVEESTRADVENLYPHALRASAANFWVRRGLDERPLKYLFGWEQMSTSANYIERNASRAIQAISEVAP